MCLKKAHTHTCVERHHAIFVGCHPTPSATALIIVVVVVLLYRFFNFFIFLGHSSKEHSPSSLTSTIISSMPIIAVVGLAISIAAATGGLCWKGRSESSSPSPYLLPRFIIAGTNVGHTGF